MAPTLSHCVWTLPLAGRRLPEASLLSPVQTCSSWFGAAGSSSKGAAAPAAWQSQLRGPHLKGNTPKSPAHISTV